MIDRACADVRGHRRRPVVIFFNAIGDHVLALPAMRAFGRLFGSEWALVSLKGAIETIFADVSVGAVCEIVKSRPDEDELVIPEVELSRLDEYLSEGTVLAGKASTGGGDKSALFADLLVCLNEQHSPLIDDFTRWLSPRRSIGRLPVFTRQLPMRGRVHAFDRAFELASALDPTLILDDFVRPVSVPPAAFALVRSLRDALPRYRFLVVHADTKLRKMWATEAWRRVLESFLAVRPDFVVIAVGSRDIGLSEGRSDSRIFCCCGLPISLAIALVNSADLFCGIDSSMLHVADLARIPGVGIFGTDTFDTFGFRFSDHEHIFDERGLSGIAPERVAEALLSLSHSDPVSWTRSRCI
ncbi:hypothetical protein [Mesorhizobium sp. M0408]|uniref:glycosyltransferase family 9 protein n=1 Tax=Mesorhizobium sp. M0408 TaxID=2956942 RepID=UPI00333E016F